MRERWESLKVAVREFFHPPRRTPAVDEADTTTADAIARWVGSHRHPNGGD